MNGIQKKILMTCASLLIAINIFSQSGVTEIYGVWSMLPSEKAKKTKTKETVIVRQDYREGIRIMFLANGTGLVFSANIKTQDSEFGWKLSKNTLEIQEDIGILKWDKFHISFKHDKSKERLYLEKIYRRNTDNEKYCLQKETIKIDCSSKIVQSAIDPQDIDLANRCRMILDREPLIVCGIFDNNRKTLLVGNNDYKRLSELKDFVQIEVFVKGYIKGNPKSIASYLVMHNGNEYIAYFIKDYSKAIRYFQINNTSPNTTSIKYPTK